MRRLSRVATCVAALALMSSAPSAHAQGDLDGAFGENGLSIVDVGANDLGTSVALQADGKTIVGGSTEPEPNAFNGDFAASRLNPDGSPDAAFGGDGTVGFGLGGNDIVYDTAVQPDGKIVLAGTSWQGGSAMAVARLNPDGSLDRSFAGDGKGVYTVAGGNLVAEGVAVQPDGKIVVAGGESTQGRPESAAVIRLQPDGDLDPGFGDEGAVLTPLDRYVVVRAMTLQPDGKIVLAGATGPSLDQSRGMAMRLDADGSIDAGFGEGGAALVDLGPNGQAEAVALQADGSVLLTGSNDAATEEIPLARLTSAGALDTAFAGDGTASLSSGAPTFANGYSVFVDSAGRIGVAGRGYDDFEISRVNPDGSLDLTFSHDGIAGATFGDLANNRQADPSDAALQADGGIVVAGTIGASALTPGNVAVARFNPPVSNPQALCAGRPATIVGTEDRDRLRGTKRRDVIAALGGKDKVKGKAKGDAVCGGGGKDRLIGAGGKDRLIGQGGRDVCIGGGGRDKARSCERRRSIR